jgi:signal transduction histidine kinase
MDWGMMSQKEFAQSSERLKIKVHNLYNLLENVLHWSITQMKGIKPKIETINIQNVINEQIALLETVAKSKGIHITQAIPSDTTIQVDKNHFAIIVRNLCQNALKFTDTHGQISFSYQNTEGGKKSIQLQDTGIGMSQETLDKLFKIEQNTHRDGTAKESGTGLGLILAKELVQLNGGTINVSSEVNKGTNFTLSFPS